MNITYGDLVTNVSSEQYKNSRTLNTPYIALRWVIELHKPYVDAGIERCNHCEGDGGNFIYPCPTIKAIAEELI